MTFSAAAGRAGEPNDPLLRLGWATTALREHRGDPHAAALLTAVISPCEALVLAAAAAPRASAWASEALLSTAFDQPHDQRSARHRQQQSAGATQQQRAHQPPRSEPPIPTTIVMPMLIGLGPGMTSRPRAPTISPDSSSPRIQSSTMTVSQRRRLSASPRHHRHGSALGRGGPQNALRRHAAWRHKPSS